MLVAVASPAAPPAASLTLLLTLLARGLLGGRPRLGLCLLAMRVRALRLRLFGAGTLLPPLFVALLLPAETAAIARPAWLLRLLLPLARSALLHTPPILAFAARTLALEALVASAARAGLGCRCRYCGLRRGDFSDGLALEQAH